VSSRSPRTSPMRYGAAVPSALAMRGSAWASFALGRAGLAVGPAWVEMAMGLSGRANGMWARGKRGRLGLVRKK
jgi:hypothetical protein